MIKDNRNIYLFYNNIIDYLLKSKNQYNQKFIIMNICFTFIYFDKIRNFIITFTFNGSN